MAPFHKGHRTRILFLVESSYLYFREQLFFYFREQPCVYFFAYNRLDYAQNIPEYIARMHEMETTDPDIWQEFANGEFTVNTSNTVPFTRIAVDQAMEHLNKSTKSQGGISVIPSNPKTLLKFCLTGPELARIAAETERLTSVSNSTTEHQQHHCLSKPKVRRQEQSITQLKCGTRIWFVLKFSSRVPWIFWDNWYHQISSSSSSAILASERVQTNPKANVYYKVG